MLYCDICGQEESSEANMKSHFLLSHVEGEMSCPICCLSGLTYDQMSQHIDTEHFEDGGESSSGGISLGLRFSNSPESTCEEIGVYNRSKSKIHTVSDLKGGLKSSGTSPKKDMSDPHLQLSSNLKITCGTPNLPQKDTDCAGSLEYQKWSVDSDQQSEHGVLQCPFCSKDENTFQTLELHVASQHSDLLKTPPKGHVLQQYECPFCQLVCLNGQVMQEHIDLHLQENNSESGTEAKGSYNDFALAKQLQEEEDQMRVSNEKRKEQEEFKKLQRQYGLDNSGGFRIQSLQSMERAVARGNMQPYEFHVKKAEIMASLAVGVDTGSTKTLGIIQALSRYYVKCGHDVKRVFLCSPIDHFHVSHGDRGWGCGYRNFQMMLSSLSKITLFQDCLKGMQIPSIPKIQSLIEESWKDGFDPQGASHFNNKLQGTKAWIGACEIYSLLTSLNLRCQIIDFHKSTGSDGTHPLLFQWVLNYFCSGGGSQKVVCTSLAPIYLQHQGHSRTIVGLEEKKNGACCLLLFDPGCPSENMRKLLKQDCNGSHLKMLRRFPGSLKHKQYQIVAAEGVLHPQEKVVRRQASKVLIAERIP